MKPDANAVPYCEQIQLDLAGIAGMVNRKMSAQGLHTKVDIFYYIDRSIKARELCSRLQLKPDEEVKRQLVMLHEQVTEKWKLDREALFPEPNIIL